MRYSLSSAIQRRWSHAMASGLRHHREGPGHRLVQGVLALCCCLLLLIGSPATAASLDLRRAAGVFRPSGTPAQQLDDEAMPELELFDSAGTAEQDELLPPLGSMASSALGSDLMGD